jgi:tRNA 2-(methylsulfanyl)-N6-isopentenyladenosine37 hydroxylase
MSGLKMTKLLEINQFLLCETPDAWVRTAVANQTTMLIDHANCEKKAAGNAVSLIFRYIEYPDLLYKISRLAREELRHFEQVVAIMKKRGIEYEYLPPCDYATELRKSVSSSEPKKLIDILIIGAFIEARSCERFAKIAPFLDDELKAFYESLLKSEARHFQDYLNLAKQYAKKDITERIAHFAQIERDLILREDDIFRFHSGTPTH